MKKYSISRHRQKQNIQVMSVALSYQYIFALLISVYLAFYAVECIYLSNITVDYQYGNIIKL